uniref:WD_REPEATS_REGION domain-containing protein n=1 Tax=Mesocestoides corti TaxID=53468 RepID=A0A5K3FK59_MESCO
LTVPQLHGKWNRTIVHRLRKKLTSDLRIGSALDIGEKYSFTPYTPGLDRRHDCRNTHESELDDKYFQPALPAHFSPSSLIMAREQGDFGFSSRSFRLRNFFTSYFSYSGVCNERVRWPANQSFHQNIQANLWSVSSFGLDAVNQHHSGCVNALNFSHSGHLIASGSDDQRVAVTDFYSGKLITRFHSGHKLNVFQVKFVPETDDLQIVSSARDGMVRLAMLHPDGRSMITTRCLAKHDDACHKIATIADAPSVFLTAGEDGCVFSIDLRECRANKILHLPLSSFYSISTNPVRPAEFCVSGKYESVVRVFDRRRLSPSFPKEGYLHSFAPFHLKAKSQHNQRQSEQAEAEDSDREVIGMDDEDADDDEEGDEDDEIEGGLLSSRLGRQILSILREDLRRRNRLASSSQEGEESSDSSNLNEGLPRRHRRVNLSARLNPLDDHAQTKFSVTAAIYSANGDAILASYNDEDIYLFNSRNDSLPPIHAYRGHRNNSTVKGVNFYGPSSEFIMSGSDDGFIYIWDRYSEGIVQWLCGDINGAVNVLEPHPTLPIFATSGCDYNFKIWAPRPGRNGDYSQPESWLSVIKDDETGRPHLYDPERVIESMRALRKSRLAKRIFGVDKNAKSVFCGETRPEDDTEAGSIGKRRWSESDDKITSPKQMRRSPTKGDKLLSVNLGNLEIAAALQERLPFNSKDLQLRVASNWAVRCHDSQSSPFAVDISDFLHSSILTSNDASNLRLAMVTRDGFPDSVTSFLDNDGEEYYDHRFREIPQPVHDRSSIMVGADHSDLPTSASSSSTFTSSLSDPSSAGSTASSSAVASDSEMDAPPRVSQNGDDYLDQIE